MTTRLRPAAKGRVRQKESPLVTAILRALKLKGVFCWRVNSGLTVLKAQGGHARRVVKGAEAGTPDILLVLPAVASYLRLGPEGMQLDTERIAGLCGIEVKTDIGKQSATQRAWQAKAERYGVRYGIARSVGEALELVREWGGKA